MAVDLQPNIACGKCCSQHCDCLERSSQPPHEWTPCNCEYCQNQKNRRDIQTRAVNGAPTNTYLTRN